VVLIQLSSKGRGGRWLTEHWTDTWYGSTELLHSISLIMVSTPTFSSEGVPVADKGEKVVVILDTWSSDMEKRSKPQLPTTVVDAGRCGSDCTQAGGRGVWVPDFRTFRKRTWPAPALRGEKD